MEYIQDWYAASRSGRSGYTVFTATALYAEVMSVTPATPFPISAKKFGHDLLKCKFITKKKTRTHNLYSVSWD
jgi:hypothetical protein